MGLIQDQPEGLPSGNDLDNVEDPDNPPADPNDRTEVYLSGAHVFTLDHVPSGLERLTFMVDVEVYETGGVRYTGENGETRVSICKARRIGDMYLPGTQRPPSKDELAVIAAADKARAQAAKLAQEDAERAEQEHNEPPMFDEEGELIDYSGTPAPAADVEDQGDGSGDADDVAPAEKMDGTVVQFSDAKASK